MSDAKNYLAKAAEWGLRERLLEVLGAEMYQGYLYSRAVPPEQAEAMLRVPAQQLRSA